MTVLQHPKLGVATRVNQGAPACRRFGFGDASVPSKGIVAQGKRRRRGACGIRRPDSRQTPLGPPVAGAWFGAPLKPAHSKQDCF